MIKSGIFLALAFAASTNAQSCWTSAASPKEVCRDKIYNSSGQTLNVYVPNRGRAPFPTVILIHGGCFQFGEKTDQDVMEQVRRLTAAGYAAVTVDYREAHPFDRDPLKRDVYPTALVDVQDAVRWVRESGGSDCELKTDKLVAFGMSAGATLADYLGTRKVLGTIGRDDRDAKPVDGVIDWFGRTQFSKSRASEPHDEHGRDCGEEFVGLDRTAKNMPIFMNAGVIENLQNTSSCFLIEHGDADEAVSHEHSVLFFRALADKAPGPSVIFKDGADSLRRQVGPRCYDELVTIKGANHGFARASELDEAWSKVCPFLNAVLGSPARMAAH